MKRKKVNCEVIVSIKTSFYDYGSQRKNRKAISEIKKYVRDAQDVLDYIPLYIETDEKNGGSVEDTTQKSKIKVVAGSYNDRSDRS